MVPTPKLTLQAAADAYAERPTPDRQDACVGAGAAFVRAMVKRFKVPEGHTLASACDLEQVGFMGLLRALEGYDPSRGTPFISYAYARIRGAITDYLRSVDAIPPEENRRCREAERAVGLLQQQRGEDPTISEVAEYLGVSLEEYHTTLQAGAYRLSLLTGTTDLPVRYAGCMEEFSTSRSLEESTLTGLPDPDAGDAFEIVDRASTHERLAAAELLPEREKNIVALYYYEELTLREIGAFLGLTPARAGQLLSRALLTLRGWLESTHNGDFA